VPQFRHRAEVPMLVLGGVVTALAALLVLVLALGGSPLPDWSSVVLVSLLTPVFAWAFFIRSKFWSTISNGVEVTPGQFPEVYREYEALATAMGFTGAGMNARPSLVVVNGNGVLNAFASKCQTSRAYVVVYSDLVDLAYRYGDFAALRFVLAHELGHVKCRHVSLWRMILSPVSTLIKLSPSIIRAQEYTADRVAAFYVPEGVRGMFALYAGKNIYQRVDPDAYLESVGRLGNSPWLRFSNFLADHAVGFRRMEALLRTRREGWDVHGRML